MVNARCADDRETAKRLSRAPRADRAAAAAPRYAIDAVGGGGNRRDPDRHAAEQPLGGLAVVIGGQSSESGFVLPAAAEYTWDRDDVRRGKVVWSNGMTIRAIYENGVFRPTEPVNLPEKTTVEVTVPQADARGEENQKAIFALLRKSYPSGESDVAERHNEHQP